MKKLLTKILKFIQGKKSVIVSLIALLITFSLTEGLIDKGLAELLSGILVLIAGGANYASYKLIK